MKNKSMFILSMAVSPWFIFRMVTTRGAEHAAFMACVLVCIMLACWAGDKKEK